LFLTRLYPPFRRHGAGCLRNVLPSRDQCHLPLVSRRRRSTGWRCLSSSRPRPLPSAASDGKLRKLSSPYYFSGSALTHSMYGAPSRNEGITTGGYRPNGVVYLSLRKGLRVHLGTENLSREHRGVYVPFVNIQIRNRYLQLI